MGNKNKTISFRVGEEAFEDLRDIAEERDLSLSALFRDYVESFVDHDGQVRIVPEEEFGPGDAGDADEFPPTVEVPKSFVREHERLELEAKHLREQLEEHKQYITALREQMEASESVDGVVNLEDLDDVVRLEDLDHEDDDAPSFQLK
ncbi:CopG family transcriptional regulator [Halocalculus aciditolerans]|uniref:CopG family transcriptional regulator n=1 Tax=Halocalculus aciditolerans TaxID=1383812 RepID=A0A830F8A6_9EURY|nr:CopG family transcriptional regulator [Halocalculus aciditolerans]GGL49270.1 CopG family transcriptional regulator [Halocalculus aciditolerans]